MTDLGKDSAFEPDHAGLGAALEQIMRWSAGAVVPAPAATDVLPASGLGEGKALQGLAESVLAGAPRFASPGWFAHMDPPTPWIAWATQLWMAAQNQNLLHPDTGEAGRRLEHAVIDALSPFFGMTGGQLVPGSTIANLTALWAARDLAGVTEVVASNLAHLSIEKAAHLLGLRLRQVASDKDGRIRRELLGDVSRAAVVLTAGTTSVGSVDALDPILGAAWVHVDAAWAGPLRLSARHAWRLAGIEGADSVAVSAHKWLWQPKDSALVLFRDWERARSAISFGGSYLAQPNVGVLGSSAARALTLAATLMAFGRDGIERRIDRCMEIAAEFASLVAADPQLELWGEPATGVIAWRPRSEEPVAMRARMASRGVQVSLTRIAGEPWLRAVAIHPGIDAAAAWQATQ